VTAPANTAYQANFKTPSGALLNVYAENGAEFDELLDAFEGFIPKIAAIESLLAGAGNVAQAAAVARPTQQPAPQEAPAPAAIGTPADGPVCEHGEPAKVIPAGVSKATGRPYRSFAACARERSQQCNFRLTL
jgi:hypothetical protein